MKIIETGIEGLLVIEPKVHADSRGFFIESFHRERYRDAGIRLDQAQANHSRSAQGVLRGLHFQLLQPQGKLVRCARGSVYDVAVDLRHGSPTFGKWHACELDDVTHRQMWIPIGFAHGFQVMSDVADFEYQCSSYYAPDDQCGIAWDDPDLAIPWPIGDPVLSEKDRVARRLSEVGLEDLPNQQGTGPASESS